MADIFGLIGTGLTAGANIAATYAANQWSKEREEIARRENYEYNERAARNADIRTRSLYYDLYAPQTQLQQLKDAGLSPSLFYGDGGGISGQSGAMGAGGAGPMGQTFGISPFDLSQLGKLMAETDLIKAQTKKTESETTQTDLENAVKELENTAYKEQWSIINSHITKSDGTQQSLAEIAESCYSYDEFLKVVREAATEGQDLILRDATTSENGQKVLRDIFTAQSKLGRDIAVLSSEKIDAQFQKQLTQCLKDFTDENGNTIPKLTAKEAVAQMRKNIEQNNLDERQKEAWNNLLNKLGHGTLQDIAIVVMMTINNALTNYGSANVGLNLRKDVGN